MRLVRLTLVLLVVLGSSPASAQVSCADPDNLCTGDPCTITTIEVQSPCVVDFGARDLVIAGTLFVPSAGTLDFTAESILMQGRIDGRHVGNGTGSGASITLTATTGDAELRGGIDVTATAASGAIDVTAAGNILVKDTLNAKTSGANITATGGAITLTAGGTITTDQTVLLDAQGAETTAAGTITVQGGGNVALGGRVRAEGNPGGTIAVTSTGGTVASEKDLRVTSEQGAAGVVTLNGNLGITLHDQVRGRGFAGGADVTLTSTNGDVRLERKVRVNGGSGSITIDAPAGTVTMLARWDVRPGGTVDVGAATIDLGENIDARGDTGGTVQIAATGLLEVNGSKIDATGKVTGGTIALLGDPASGDVTVAKGACVANGGSGAAGAVTVSAPAGTVTLPNFAATVKAKNGLGGTVQIDGVALSVGPKAIFVASDGGEVRFDQSGAGLFTLVGKFNVSDGGVVEALAPAGSLTASGRVTTDGGCAGFAAGGTLDTTALVADVSITPSCP